MTRRARAGLSFLSLSLLLELWLYARIGASPVAEAAVVWEGPLSATLWLAGLACLLADPRLRRLGIVVGAGTGVALLLALVSFEAPPTSEMRIEVLKSRRIMRIYRAEVLLKEYRVALGPSPELDKALSGDGRTPEGRFRVSDKAPSTYHKWLGLDYPRAEDAWRGRREGLLTWPEFCLLRFQSLHGRVPYGKTVLGGDVGIHGGGDAKDWTLGCVALTNENVDAVYADVPVGTLVEIFP